MTVSHLYINAGMTKDDVLVCFLFFPFFCLLSVCVSRAHVQSLSMEDRRRETGGAAFLVCAASLGLVDGWNIVDQNTQ